MANVMGSSIIRSLQNGMILEDFIKSINVCDLGGKVHFSLNTAKMDGALQENISSVTRLFNLGSHCHADTDRVKGQSR